MDVAKRFAALSSCERRKVGAIIVKDDNIISIGYNGTPAGDDNVCEIDGITKPEVIHAEENAILKLARFGGGGDGSVLFVTLMPCISCAKLIYGCGIKKVYYAEDYRDDSGVLFLKKRNILVEKLN